MIFDLIATILVLYLLYKLVFDFIVPVSRTTAQFRDHVNDVRRQQEQMRTQQQQNNDQRTKPASNKPNTTNTDKPDTTTTDGEYIDFEEVK